MDRVAQANPNLAAFAPPSMLSRIARAYRRHGPGGFAALCLYNLKLLWTGEFRAEEHVYDDTFDRTYGVNTLGRVDVDEIEAPEELKAGTVRYEAIEPHQFDHLIARAEMRDPGRYSFIDIGSGKGRALILAGLAGFGRVVGVEYGLNLHRDAVANVERLRARGLELPIELVNGDATLYRFPAEATVCLLNNPFGEPLLERFLDNAEQSLRSAPRDFRLIYLHCNHADLLRRRPDWQEYATGDFGSCRHRYAIFRWRGPAQT